MSLYFLLDVLVVLDKNHIYNHHRRHLGVGGKAIKPPTPPECYLASYAGGVCYSSILVRWDVETTPIRPS
jgi:hypothetical protein